MPPSDDGTMSNLAFKVPTNHKTALVLAADSRSTAFERTTLSDIGREAIEEWFSNHVDELPEEALDALDKDNDANAGGDDE